MRRYRGLMTDDHWSEDDVREDLKSRGDYRKYSSTSRDVDPDRVIRRAYEDILHREPDQEGLRHYRTEMIDNGWTEQDVRQALRKSTEHDSVSQSSADRIVKRAYQDILGRDPDYNGLVQVPEPDHGPRVGRARRSRGPEEEPGVPAEERHDPGEGRGDRAARLPERAGA